MKDCNISELGHFLKSYLFKITRDHELKIQFPSCLLQRAPAAATNTSVALTGSSLEETISAVEKSRHYQSGMNNLAPDNVDLPNRSGVAIG